jgi:hypothetical protein
MTGLQTSEGCTTPEALTVNIILRSVHFKGFLYRSAEYHIQSKTPKTNGVEF